MNDSIEHSNLPLPEFDHIPLGTLPQRIAPLDEAGVTTLLDYEQAHANRLPVVQVLTHRLEALKNGAEPSGSIPDSMPEVRSGSDVSPEGPKTDAPPVNPPAHGNPANPAQPRG
ncbi:hypothetical protein D9V29_13935 [Mycetocola manganoxydans]|uniref:DUF8129 domain-containing protein n=1 Tax=Mycetocola manganoxydans TaxID=699879 RepID=A0A3L6ZK01_9MICO|nr:hypothetical protein [Mycetocola manganoxydans]RLP68324.1 hypothetical protein D9V29_13935 [Mycetocola manganoxydans]GHD43729.1 hypothetical protein GCM10008097_10780 [Mycetocola manganoxydans]